MQPTRITSFIKLASIITLGWIGQLFAINLPIAPEQATSYQTKPLVNGNQSMVVTNNPWATKAAHTILAKGGSASDAAIAAAFMLGLTEPQSSGIGGGGYALTYQAKTKQVLAFDGREVAPHSATPNWLLNESGMPLTFNEAMLSAHSVGTPSEVALLFELHRHHGKLPWAQLLQPAIELAQKGFPLSPRLHDLLVGDQEVLKQDPNIRQVYFTANGQVKPVGALIINRAYAKTLSTLARDPKSINQGALAKAIVTAINQKAKAPIYQLSDLANYKVLVKPALCSNYRESYQICSVPPSSSGGVTVLELLNLYAKSAQSKTQDPLQWSYNFIEASKLAYADRNQYIADPAFVPQPVTGLLADDYLESRAQLIHKQPQAVPVLPGVPHGSNFSYGPDHSPKPHGTTSIVVVDKDGNAISMTVTVEHQFGSHIFTNGFFLNNELTDFSFAPTTSSGQPIANRVEAGKRPRSSIAPTMVFNQESQLTMLVGSPGGSQIICYVAKNIIQMLDLGLSPQQAAASPNLCAVNTRPQIEVNAPGGQELFNYLNLRGESATVSELVSGETNILRNPQGGWLGSADPRREGLAIGN